MSHQYATLEDTVYFWFAANNTSGSGADGSTPVYDVRLGGAAAGAAPVLSGSATLLTHADFPDGCHEIAIAATAANGFASGNTYGVFCTLLVDSQNPTGFVGSFKLSPIPANVTHVRGTTSAGDAGYIGIDWGNITNKTTTNNLSSTYVNSTGVIGNLDALASNLTLNHGAGAWTTATGFAVAGDAMTLTSAYDFAKGTVAVTESYNTGGAAPTPVQALMVIMQMLTEMSISGTTMTIKKLDGSTTAMTLTLNADPPTSVTRAS